MTFNDYAKLWGKNCELNEKRKNPFDVIFQEIDDMRDEKHKQQNKLNIHKEICNNLHETYEAKNADYGDSFALVRGKYPNAILIRLNDKLNRLETLMNGGKQHVDESIDDTLLDLANYCIMELVERRSDD